MTHLQDKWIKITNENQGRKHSQPIGKAKRQLLEIAIWKRFALDGKI
jgi:hypothetical protein